LEPLGLKSVYLEGREPSSGIRAHGFSTRYTGKLSDIALEPNWGVEYSAAWIAGAPTGTALDVARWMRALYGGELLEATSLAAMTKWTSQSDFTYGLATARLQSSRGDFWGHNGGILGFRTRAGHSPSRKMTVVVMINRDDADPRASWDALVSAL